ncbi:MAG: response regulator [Bacteroidota bacterium]
MGKILIVEDDYTSYEPWQQQLQLASHEVLPFTESGEEAWELIQSESPDLVILDIKLKGKLTGLDVAKKIRKAKITIPIIFLSTRADKYEEYGDVHRPIDFLPKPCKPRRLQRLVSRILKDREQLMEAGKTAAEGIFFIAIDGVDRRFRFEEILMVKTSGQGNSLLCLETTRGTFTFTGKLTQMLKEISVLVSIGRSSAVNPFAVVEIDTKNGHLTLEKDKKVIHVSLQKGYEDVYSVIRKIRKRP